MDIFGSENSGWSNHLIATPGNNSLQKDTQLCNVSYPLGVHSVGDIT